MSFLGGTFGSSGGDLLHTDNTWTGLNTFTGGLKLTTTPVLGNDVVNVSYVNSALNFLVTNDNTWSGTNIFTKDVSFGGRIFVTNANTTDTFLSPIVNINTTYNSVNAPYLVGVYTKIKYTPTTFLSNCYDYYSQSSLDAGAVGTLTEMGGIRIDSPLLVSGVVDNCYGIQVTAPTIGLISNSAINTTNIVIGNDYFGVTPPVNGALIEGFVGIGMNTTVPVSLLTVGPVSGIFDPNFVSFNATACFFGVNSPSPAMAAILNVVNPAVNEGAGGNSAQMSFVAQNAALATADCRMVTASRIFGTTNQLIDPINQVGGSFNIEVLNNHNTLRLALSILATRHITIKDVDAVTLPNPIGGGYFYSQDGALYWKGPSTTTLIAPA